MVNKFIGCLVLCIVIMGGCTTGKSMKSVDLPSSPKTKMSDVTLQELAGSWEYVDGNVNYPLILDQEGKGTYEWKKGRFETTSVSNGLWKGTWHQVENDREGGFELQIDPDRQGARGSWWYTRIGNDDDPLEPGGEFSLQRNAPNLD